MRVEWIQSDRRNVRENSENSEKILSLIIGMQIYEEGYGI